MVSTICNTKLGVAALALFSAVAASVLMAVVLASPAQAVTPLTNGGFETGDLSGWTTTGVPNGTATVETSFTCPNGECFGTTVSPVEGSKFALLTPGDLGVYTTVSQTFAVGTAGEEIIGQARFLSQEAINTDFNDQAEVVIKDASNNEVIAFSAGSSTTKSTPWTQWRHTFLVAGTYSVEARVKNMGLPGSPSRLALDKVSLEPDTTPPQLHLPADITEQAPGHPGAQVSWQAPTATDANPANPRVSCDADSGDTFSVGTTTVNCSATDAAGNIARGSFDVTVQDTTAPKVSTATPTGTGIARGTNVAATFSEKMGFASITKSTFKLFKVTPSGTTQVSNGTVTLSSNGLKATLNPYGTSSTLLAARTRYKAVVTTGARDLADNALDQNSTRTGNQQKSWTFTTKG